VVAFRILATVQEPFGAFVVAVIPDIAISDPRESPCGTVVVTVIALPEYAMVGGSNPIAELVKGAAEYIAVLLTSRSAVIVDSLFIDLALYENVVVVIEFTIKFPLAIDKKVS
jgi:hypothetical protein